MSSGLTAARSSKKYVVHICAAVCLPQFGDQSRIRACDQFYTDESLHAAEDRTPVQHGACVMILQNRAAQYCQGKATECARLAKIASTSATAELYWVMERRWLGLATKAEAKKLSTSQWE